MRTLLFLHLLGAAIWVGGHLVLALGILPGALRRRDPQAIRAFEQVYERIGIPALLLQVVSGLWLASLWLQYDEAIARTQLVAHVTPFEFQQGIDPAELARLSRLIDQQATLIGTANLLMLLAGACCVIAIVAVSQRALK